MSWNEEKYGHGSQPGPKPRMTVLTTANSKLLLCSTLPKTLTMRMATAMIANEYSRTDFSSVGKSQHSTRVFPEDEIIHNKSTLHLSIHQQLVLYL
jgi:hypothetical protein